MQRIIGFAFGLCMLVSLPVFAGDWRTKVDPEVLAELETGARVQIIVAFAEQADLRLAYRLRDKAAKGRFVYRQVREVADRSQAPVRQLLIGQRVPYQPFAIVNALLTEVDWALAKSIAERPEVANLQPNPWTTFDAPALDLSPRAGGRGTIEWGVERIGAPLVWDMGYRGEGVVIGGQDTGYEWGHPTLQQQYRGWDGTQADHNYNWHDAIREINLLHNDTLISPSNNPCGLDINTPCDDINHGTHTMGTMVGDDGENQIGVAPAARWVGCRNMERGYGSPATYIECFEWFLAPTDLAGENPDPAQAPHVINNSWGCPAVEGCNPDNFALMELAVNALRAAGVVVVVSAGNSGGSGCGSIDDPAAIFEGSFTIGATQNNDTIANFSSRGAVTIDSSFRLKPNVSAPGVGVRSAVRNGGFASFSGTSMAGPHVAGAVALMISAAPHLAGQVDTIEAILQETALPMMTLQDCAPYMGMTIPNTAYGYGRIDVRAAVERALQVVSTNTAGAPQAWQVFPNPATDHVWVNTSTDTESVFTLFDATGRLLQTHTLANELERVGLTGLPAGSYTYRLVGGTQMKTGVIIVQ